VRAGRRITAVHDYQADGRIRHWGRITLPGEEKTRILRVVTLADGVTLHNGEDSL